MSVFRPAALALALAASLPIAGFTPPARAAAAATTAASVDIPYETFTLPNGLRVIVHTDRKAPIVAVNLWYHVGSKDEPAGRTGFAHLFEHLMFNGSENAPGEFFTPFKAIGATNQNGTTNSDRTNYFENVPTTALDTALWMESDRMGHLLGAIDQKTLDEQRGVVQNEKRQGENQPYGQVWDVLGKAMYPASHPYHHSTIGSMNDLNAASLEDVKTWFRTWYGPNNAVLVLAGDIDLATAKEKVAKYFGDIPAGPTMAQPKVDVAAHTADTRSEMTDNVPQSRIYRVWNVAEYGQPDLDRLQVLARILGGGKVAPPAGEDRDEPSEALPDRLLDRPHEAILRRAAVTCRKASAAPRRRSAHKAPWRPMPERHRCQAPRSGRSRRAAPWPPRRGRPGHACGHRRGGWWSRSPGRAAQRRHARRRSP